MHYFILVLACLYFPSLGAEILQLQAWEFTSAVNGNVFSSSLSNAGQKGTYELVIRRSNGLLDSEYPQFTDEPSFPLNKFERMFKHMFGPDEIVVLVEGKTLQGFLAEYGPAGIYSVTFRISVSGYYHISVYRTRHDYGALNETHTEWPMIVKENLVTDWLYLERTEFPECHNHNVGGEWREIAPSQFDFQSLAEAKQVKPVPVLVLYEPNESQFNQLTYLNLSLHAPDEQEPGEPAGSGCVSSIDRYKWHTSQCDRTFITPDEAVKLLSKVKVSMQCDSLVNTI